MWNKTDQFFRGLGIVLLGMIIRDFCREVTVHPTDWSMLIQIIFSFIIVAIFVVKQR